MRYLKWGVALALVACAWLVFAPRQVGGSVSYVVTQGNSMEPVFAGGDLVIVREDHSYEAGEIVAFDSRDLGRIVLHRILEVDGGTLTTKGDNNGWVDPERPQVADVIGEKWLHVPGAGTLLAWFRSPVGAALLAAVIGLSLFWGSKTRNRTEGERAIGLPKMSGASRGPFVACGVAAVAGLALAGLGFSRPEVSPVARDAAYEHVAEFSYGADVRRNPVYPDGRIDTADTVFLKVVDRLDVAVRYAMRADAAHEVAGKVTLAAVVTGGSGWTKSFPIAEGETDGTGTITGTVDLTRLTRVATQVQTITGVPEATQTVDLVASLALEGTAAGERFTEKLSPKVSLQMDAFQVKPLPADGASTGKPSPADFVVRTPGTVSVTDLTSNRIGVGRFSIPVPAARRIGLGGLGLAALAALALILGSRRAARPQDEPSAISARWNEWLIPAAHMAAPARQGATRLASMESLVRLAEVYERMILHSQEDGIHTYVVERDGATYYYQAVAAGARPVAPVPSAPPPPPPRRARRDDLAQIRAELQGIEEQVLRQEDAAREER